MGAREDSTNGGVGSRRGWMSRAVSFWRCGTTDPAEAGPRVMWRMGRWNVFLGASPGIAFLVVSAIAFRIGGSLISASVASAMCAAAMLVLALLLGCRTRRVLAHAKSVEYRVCPECGYSLVDLEEERGTCPECGTGYTRAGLWDVWTRG